MKKLNNKGFTLIEIVIVIVIIAILAAMLVPSLTSWIDKSKMKTFTSACGTIKTAVWSQAAENYAVSGDVGTIDYTTVSADVGKTVVGENGTLAAGGYKVTAMNYNNGSITVTDGTFTGVWASSTATSWTVTKGNQPS